MINFSDIGFGEDCGKYSDEELVLRFQAGDSRMFEEIYLRWKDRIYSYLRTFLNYNQEDALQVASNVFLNIYKFLLTNKVQKLKSLLYRIAHNEAINYIQTHKSENFYNISTQLIEILTDNQDTQNKHNLNIKYKQKLLAELLSRLEPKYREIIYLFYYENKDYEQIAHITGSNKNTVGTNLKRAKQKFEEIILQSGLQGELAN